MPGNARTGTRRVQKRRPAIEGISKTSIRRLGRRAGVKRMAGSIVDEVRTSLLRFLVKILRGAVTYADHRNKKTISTLDIVRTLKREGFTLYGFGYYAVEEAENEEEGG